jgi:hypothetical protein
MTKQLWGGIHKQSHSYGGCIIIHVTIQILPVMRRVHSLFSMREFFVQIFSYYRKLFFFCKERFLHYIGFKVLSLVNFSISVYFFALFEYGMEISSLCKTKIFYLFLWLWKFFEPFTVGLQPSFKHKFWEIWTTIKFVSNFWHTIQNLQFKEYSLNTKIYAQKIYL